MPEERTMLHRGMFIIFKSVNLWKQKTRYIVHVHMYVTTYSTKDIYELVDMRYTWHGSKRIHNSTI